MLHAVAHGFQGTTRFEIKRRIGEGAVGVVYEALDREHDRRVALKTLRTLNVENLLSLKHEFRAIQDLRHPHLVSLGELLEADGTWFFTMELLSGEHFLEHVRPGRSAAALGGSVANDVGFDETRLRRALAQLVDGLCALHRAGIVHRDIKPSNVVVTPQNRVVILDFGLATEALRGLSNEGMVGTAPYMSPEQVLCSAVGPAADWYAVGAVLYQALTGSVPFEGTFQMIAEQKVSRTPVPPNQRCAGIPEDLNTLCMALLRMTPEERPSDAELAQRFALAARDDTQVAHGLVGRRHERETLNAAFAEREHGHGASVLVSGESGVGKSFLVRAFLADMRASHPDLLVLTGRCYERESVPYKALDGVIDQLSQLLSTLPETEVAELMPAQAVFLARAFPVLEGVANSSQGHTLSPVVANPRELRRRVFSALRELFVRLAHKRRVVLAIDDLQWADSDSFELLHELMRVPEEPPLLLIGTVRAGTEARRTGAANTLNIPGIVHHVELRPLASADACELARELLTQMRTIPPAEDDVRRIVEDAKGHPLFIEELIRGRAPAEEATVLRLDDALWRRVQKLDASERRMLELLAVAGAPITRETAARAAAIELGHLYDSEAKLRAATLIRMSGAQRDSELEPYHDRVRESVLAHLAPDVRSDWHTRLACALEQQSDADPESIAGHWTGAGKPERAAEYYVRAAERAAKALAFDRAARLYEEALATKTFDDARTRVLSLELAEALGNAGRLAAAADVRLDLARTAEPVARLELEQRAAQHLMCSGHFERGTTLLNDTLRSLGLFNPSSRLMLILAVIWSRLLLALRGFAPRPRPAPAPAQEMMLVDACWAAGQGFAMHDNIRGTYFHTRGLLRALEAGDPARLARAMGIATISAAAPGVSADQRVAPMLARTRELAEQLGTPEALAFAAAASGFTHFNGGRWRDAQHDFDQAEMLFRDQCLGKSYETSTVRGMLLRTLFNLGDFRELALRTPPILRQCQQQRDLYLELICQSASSAMLGLARDDLHAADQAVKRSIELLVPGPVRLQHYWAYTAECQVALYRGEGSPAYERMAWLFPELKRALLTQVTSCRMVTMALKGRAAVAAAREQPAHQSRLLDDAEAAAAALAAELVPWGKPAATAIHASVAVVRNEHDAALRLYGEAATAYDALDMTLFAAAAKRLEGQLRNDTQGQQLIALADARFRAQGIQQPERMTAMLVAATPTLSE